MVVRCWLAFFRLVHMFGWKFAVARVKLTGVGFKFWPNVPCPPTGETEKEVEK
jgi:hypothetical protein